MRHPEFHHNPSSSRITHPSLSFLVATMAQGAQFTNGALGHRVWTWIFLFFAESRAGFHRSTPF